jgi:hypothetical protein
MAIRAILFGAGLLAAGVIPAAADTVTSTIKSWEPETRTLVLGDNSQFQAIATEVFVPEELSAGQTVTITFEGAEDSVEKVISVEIQP